MWSLLSIAGKDAADYLHRITTVHVLAMAPGDCAAGCVLAATGKILLYFKLERSAASPDNFLLASPYPTELALAEIERLHFAEQFKAESLHGTKDYAPTLARIAPEHTLGVGQRIEQGLASYPEEIGPGVLPLECGLDHAVHQNKGCYPGQEVIEKIRSYGKAPRLLMRVSGTAKNPQTTPSPIQCQGPDSVTHHAGDLTSAAYQKNTDGSYTLRGLALIKRVRLQEGTRYTLVNDLTINITLEHI